MLHTSLPTEARALVHLAEEIGVDPERAALYWHEATAVEAAQVVRYAQRVGLSSDSEWAGDFLSAHRWGKRHGVKAAAAELGLVIGQGLSLTGVEA
jgi:hypothetical protein